LRLEPRELGQKKWCHKCSVLYGLLEPETEVFGDKFTIATSRPKDEHGPQSTSLLSNASGNAESFADKTTIATHGRKTTSAVISST